MNLYRSVVSLELLDDELNALVEVGGYASTRELLCHALEVLLDANPVLRLEMAITLWKRKKVTLRRAAEMARCDHESFKQEIANRGLYIEIDMSAEEVRREAQQIPLPRSAT